MSLAYYDVDPLAIPDEAFDANDMATLVVTGTTYGGEWVMNAISVHTSPEDATAIGSFETDEAPGRPDLAVEAAKAWMTKECERLGLTILTAQDQNHTYSASDAPYFAGISFIIGRRR